MGGDAGNRPSRGKGQKTAAGSEGYRKGRNQVTDTAPTQAVGGRGGEGARGQRWGPEEIPCAAVGPAHNYWDAPDRGSPR